MALVVNTNINSLNAQRNLEGTGRTLAKSLERLSSGLRINSAADDAAGLAIATRLGAQVRGLNQAIRNANDGSALLQTAEGALSEVTNIVTRIKELAVQSANGTNSSTDRASLNGEVQSLTAEVTRIASQTKFGSTALLDGTFNTQFQVGVNSGETVGATVASFQASALSGTATSAIQDLTFHAAVDAVGAADGNTFAGLATAGDLTIVGPDSNGVAVNIRATVLADDIHSFLERNKSAIAVTAAINDSTGATGVTATATAATVDLTGSFANNINIDGVTANQVLKINGTSITVNVAGADAAAWRAALIAAIQAQSGTTGVGASAGSGNTHVILTAADGRNISIEADGTGANTGGGELFGFTTNVNTEKVVARGGVQLTAKGNITTALVAGLQPEVGGEGTATAASATVTLSQLDISSLSGANQALAVADAVLNTISSARGYLGAIENRLGSTVANLSVVSEKVTDARSRILDADFAAETAALTKAQILQQAGISVLAQSNTAPQAALKLLQ